MPTSSQARLNIYLPNQEFHRAVKVAAAKRGVTVSELCTEAIETLLAREERDAIRSLPASKSRKSAKALDELRRRVGPIGVSVSELIYEGRTR